MCGRYTLCTAPERLRERFEAEPDVRWSHDTTVRPVKNSRSSRATTPTAYSFSSGVSHPSGQTPNRAISTPVPRQFDKSAASPTLTSLDGVSSLLMGFMNGSTRETANARIASLSKTTVRLQ